MNRLFSFLKSNILVLIILLFSVFLFNSLYIEMHRANNALIQNQYLIEKVHEYEGFNNRLAAENIELIEINLRLVEELEKYEGLNISFAAK